MEEPIEEILDATIIDGLRSAQGASLRLIRYDRDRGGEIATPSSELAPSEASDIRTMFLDPATYWLGLKRCAPLQTVTVHFSPIDLIATLDFRCNDVTFAMNAFRSHAFFDHRRDDLMILVNQHFPMETSLECPTLVKKEFLAS